MRQAEMLYRINRARFRRHQLPPLACNPCLTAAAKWKAGRMLAEGWFAHVTPEGEWANATARRFGYPLPARYPTEANQVECLYRGMPSWRHAIRALLASPPHRAALLSRQNTEIGMAWAHRIGRGVMVTYTATRTSGDVGDSQHKGA